MKIPTWKHLALQAYYHSTLLPRQLWSKQLELRGRAPIVMVYYHRIADDNANDWTLSNAMFAEHIRFLQRRFELISLEECQRRMRAGRNDRLAVHITFDDGYAENCEHALPLLLRENIPFTYFVTSENMFTGEPFTHDVKYGCPRRPNSMDEIKELAAAGVEIGAHTRTHADLGRITTANELFEELVECRHELEAAAGVPVRYFAFPFGLHKNLNADAFQMARDHGYEGLCSAYGGYNFPGGDIFHLQRFDGSPIYTQFRNWMQFDPLKHFRVKPFCYEGGKNLLAPELVPLSTSPAESETFV